jgi:hypothetical protein
MTVAPPSSPPARLAPITTDQLREALERRRRNLIEASRVYGVGGPGQERADLLASTERSLADVERALARMRTGRYGSCERCGERLSLDRLAADPDTRRCVLCS